MKIETSELLGSRDLEPHFLYRTMTTVSTQVILSMAVQTWSLDHQHYYCSSFQVNHGLRIQPLPSPVSAHPRVKEFWYTRHCWQMPWKYHARNGKSEYVLVRTKEGKMPFSDNCTLPQGWRNKPNKGTRVPYQKMTNVLELIYNQPAAELQPMESGQFNNLCQMTIMCIQVKYYFLYIYIKSWTPLAKFLASLL